jgi:C-terminal processing protease CtpA/Prc
LDQNQTEAEDKKKKIVEEELGLVILQLERPATTDSSEVDTSLFDVSIPQGKLGILLYDEPCRCFPTIHKVYPTSVFHGKVQEGDLIIQIDGQSCKEMSSLETCQILLNFLNRKREFRVNISLLSPQEEQL